MYVSVWMNVCVINWCNENLAEKCTLPAHAIGALCYTCVNVRTIENVWIIVTACKAHVPFDMHFPLSLCL